MTAAAGRRAPLRILFAEDDQNDAKLTMRVLAQHGLADDLTWVQNGREALDWIYRRNAHAMREPGLPDGILLDLKMPLVDGLQVLAQVRGDRETRSIPIVMLTSSGQEADVVRGYALGVTAYIIKQIGHEEFGAAVGEAARVLLLALPART